MTAIRSTPLNLAIVIENFDLDGGGAERNVLEIARHLTARGHRVTILCGGLPQDTPQQIPEARIEQCPTGKPKTAWRLYRFANWASKKIRNGKFEASLSVTMSVPATVVEPLGGTVRETLARNIAMRSTHGARRLKRWMVRLSPKQQTLLALEHRTINDLAVKRIVALSRYVVKQLQQGYGVQDDRIELIPNAVEMTPISEQDHQARRARVRKGLGISADSVVFLFSAYNPRLKGFVPLLDAMGLLKAHGHDATLLLAGRFGYREHQMVVKAGVRQDVRFVGVTQRMADLYCAADVTVHPTFYDSSGRIVIESLVMGTPAITTAYAGASDLIQREDGSLCGRVIAEPGDVRALADAMAQMTDTQERLRCGQATAGLAQSLTMASHVDRLEALLVESVAG